VFVIVNEMCILLLNSHISCYATGGFVCTPVILMLKRIQSLAAVIIYYVLSASSVCI